MKVKIKTIELANNEYEKCVIFEVLMDTDIGKYILLDYSASKITHTFWFPDLQVKKGDMVHLYISKNKKSEISLKSNSNNFHEIFWSVDGLGEELQGNCLVLVEANDWMFQDNRLAS